MELTKEKESSSTGKKTGLTTKSEGVTAAEKGRILAQSGRRPKSTPREQNASYPTLAEHLPIFQEDLRVLRLAGARFTIVPDLQPLGKLVIVFDDIGYKDGELFVKSHGSDG